MASWSRNTVIAQGQTSSALLPCYIEHDNRSRVGLSFPLINLLRRWLPSSIPEETLRPVGIGELCKHWTTGSRHVSKYMYARALVVHSPSGHYIMDVGI